MAQYKGKTEDAASPILGAPFWKKGVKVTGVVLREFQTTNGVAYELSLKEPVKVKGNLERKVSIGGMKGFHMALNAAGLEELLKGDRVIIECVGFTDTGKGNPRVDFNVGVDRPE